MKELKTSCIYPILKIGVFMMVNTAFFNETNAEYARSLIFSDPITGEELRPFRNPKNLKDGSFVIYVKNKDGTRKWKHTIKTEEL